MVPRFIILLLFVVAFLLTFRQYARINAKRRVVNLRFAMMVGAIVGAIGYNFFSHFHRDDRLVSWLFLALALFWVACSCYLWRRMPPREQY